MKAIVYCSDSHVALTQERLADMAAQFGRKNAALDITGYLFLLDGRFFQYLEGEPGPVSELMARIERDERHTVHQCYEKHSVGARAFPAWSMRVIEQGALASWGLEHIVRRHFERLAHASAGRDVWAELLWSTVARIAASQRDARQ